MKQTCRIVNDIILHVFDNTNLYYFRLCCVFAPAL